MDPVLDRRSIRKYTSQPVPPELVDYLVRAGMSAPSAGNQRPWHFVVITDRSVLDDIPSVHPYSAMLKEAPLAILVCGDEALEIHKGYWIQDCAAAVENILIAAQAKGLGSVWLGVYPREERVAGIKRIIGIPEGVTPLALIAIGYPNETKQYRERYEAQKVHYNKW